MLTERNSKHNPVGGTKVIAVDLINQLSSRGFHLEAVDISGGVTHLSPWKLRCAIRIVWGLTVRLWRCDLVYLMMSTYWASTVASSFWVVCWLTRKPLVLRFTGSELGEVYRSYGAISRWISDHTYMRSSLVYVETRQLIQEFESRKNFRWLPNTRDIRSTRVRPRQRGQVQKLVFISQLRRGKGLEEMLEACRSLPKGCHLNVYGPPMPGNDLSQFDNHSAATYCGVLPSVYVPNILMEHDLLLFPSYIFGEGHPGIIIEAFQCGVPVIASDWKAIPELVEHEVNGLLVEPRSSSQLRAAILRLIEDPALYVRLCRGAMRSGEVFDSSNWYNSVASDLRRLCGVEITGAASQHPAE